MIKRILFIGLAIISQIPISAQPLVYSSGEKSQREGKQIVWEVISAGGNMGGSSTNYNLSGTLGQMATGVATSTKYISYPGFWGPYGGFDCHPGDADGTLPIDILDIVHLIDYKFKECPPDAGPGTCPPPILYRVCSGDADCNCTVDILDIILMIDWKFKECPPGAGPGTCPPPCSNIEWQENCGRIINK